MHSSSLDTVVIARMYQLTCMMIFGWWLQGVGCCLRAQRRDASELTSTL